MVTIAVPAEQQEIEPRVALSPDMAKRFVGRGCRVQVQAGAGHASHYTDAEFEAAGASIAGTVADTLKDADVVLTVRRPAVESLEGLKSGAVIVGMLDPFDARDGLEALAKTGATVFTMEYLPRISRAQSMDVLSSQSNLAGYKAVIDGAAAFDRAMPMMMTAAGTVPAARVFVMGAGVGGLQAIATARRLGAVVSATDVRPAVKEQVESLGGKFVAVENEEFKQAETAGGYAKEMSDDYKRQQAELISEHIKTQDIVITTAFIPGRPAPRLISKAQVESMRQGAVIVDMAVERGGNCELAKAGKTVQHGGVKILGRENLAGALSASASSLYARNLFTFVELLLGEDGKLAIDWNDEIVAGTLIGRDGALVHPALTDKGET